MRGPSGAAISRASPAAATRIASTGPAARVYNVLLSENRRVAALLLAAP